MGSVLTFKRMRRRPLPFSLQAAARALAPNRPTLPPAMAWRKRPRAPAAPSPQAARSVTNISNETHIHPARDITRETMHFASIRQQVVAAAALGRQAATSGIASLQERSRRVERVLLHVWRRHDLGRQPRSQETPRSLSAPAAATREHRHTNHFVTFRRLPVAYQPARARRNAAMAPAMETRMALPAGPQATPRASSAPLAALPMRIPARHPPAIRPASRQMTAGAARNETPLPIPPVASDFRLPRRVSPAEHTAPSEISLEWRKAVQKIATQTSAPASTQPPGEQVSQGATSSPPGRAASRSESSSLAPPRNSVPAVDPAFADRLVDDVIRRIERRQRIERERRGL